MFFVVTVVVFMSLDYVSLITKIVLQFKCGKSVLYVVNCHLSQIDNRTKATTTWGLDCSVTVTVTVTVFMDYGGVFLL